MPDLDDLQNVKRVENTLQLGKLEIRGPIESNYLYHRCWLCGKKANMHEPTRQYNLGDPKGGEHAICVCRDIEACKLREAVWTPGRNGP